MILELNLTLASAAVLAAIGALIAVFTQKKACRRWQEATEAGIYHVKQACEERILEIRTEIELHFKESLTKLDASLRAPEQAVTEGRLSRSSRSEALRLLRSGMAPETAATTLGMPRNDLELLSKVAGILAAH